MRGHRPGARNRAERFHSPPHAGAAYAGIGSRSTPPEVQADMRSLAATLASAGWVLRTGASPGADRAFLNGALDAGGLVELYLPFEAFGQESWREADPALLRVLGTPTSRAFELGSRVHPAWTKLGQSERRLRARDCHQVLGVDLAAPAKLVVCWTAGGGGGVDGGEQSAEGTGQALRLASREGIAVFNLARERELERLLALVAQCAQVSPGTGASEKRTPVSSSESAHRRAAADSSRAARAGATMRGAPLNSPGPSGPT